MPHESISIEKIDFFKVKFNSVRIDEIAEKFSNYRFNNSAHEVDYLLKTLSYCDLTTLSGDDSISNVRRVVAKGINPFSNKTKYEVQKKFGKDITNIKVAGICVYPSQISEVKRCLGSSGIKIAAVATGFPSGQYGIKSKLEEIQYCIKEGANEIDIVISRSLVFQGKWKELYKEIAAIVKATPSNVKIKCILETGQLNSYEDIYKASMISMLAGVDTIKTSTGKEANLNATASFCLIMCLAISRFYNETGRLIGFKPAGGMKTSKDALRLISVVINVLGEEYLGDDTHPCNLRLGCSSLLGGIESRLLELATGTSVRVEGDIGI